MYQTLRTSGFPVCDVCAMENTRILRLETATVVCFVTPPCTYLFDLNPLKSCEVCAVSRGDSFLENETRLPSFFLYPGGLCFCEGSSSGVVGFFPTSFRELSSHHNTSDHDIYRFFFMEHVHRASRCRCVPVFLFLCTRFWGCNKNKFDPSPLSSISLGSAYS